MKILVTGGAGFIASNIVDAYIQKGHEVVVIDNLITGFKENINPKAKFIEMDIKDSRLEELFQSEKFEIVNHHAAQMDIRISVNNPIFDAQTNIIGGINIYEAARKSGVKKIIFASTGGAIYGEQSYFPADEEHPTNPCSPYGISKLTNEKYLYYYKNEYNIDYAILRYGNVFGPRQSYKGEAGVVAIFVNKILSGEQSVINGDGLNTRDYVYIEDVVNANLFALNDNFHGIYNVSTGKETDVNTIFDLIVKISGSNCKEYHGPAKPGEQRRSVCSYDKIQNDFNWSPKTKLDDGLKKTFDYFKSKFNAKLNN